MLGAAPPRKWETSRELLKAWKGRSVWERQRLRCQVGRWVERRRVLLARKPDWEGGLVGELAVVIVVGSRGRPPAGCPELNDLQQQQLGQGAEAGWEQEAIPDQDKELIHALPVHLLQLLPNPVQLQHQAVHLQGTVGGDSPAPPAYHIEQPLTELLLCARHRAWPWAHVFPLHLHTTSRMQGNEFRDSSKVSLDHVSEMPFNPFPPRCRTPPDPGLVSSHLYAQLAKALSIPTAGWPSC